MSLETWTPERVEQLRTFVVTGLTCSQIAAQIGVSRNAVIGKIHRLGLQPVRPPGAPGPSGASARLSPHRVRRSRLSPQRHLLRLVCGDAESAAEGAAAMAIDSAQRCSLLDLGQDKCRWPLSDPGRPDFAFCGNEAITGCSYCAGHTQMAYRLPARRRA